MVYDIWSLSIDGQRLRLKSRRIYGRRNENTQGILNQIGSTN